MLCIRVLKGMTSQFPSFGVLFDTLNQIKTNLIYFIIVSFNPNTLAIVQYDIPDFAIYGNRNRRIWDLDS